MTEVKKITKFEELLTLNVNDKIEKKKSGNAELTYLSWSFAVAEMEKAYPEWEYNILEFNGLPYQFDQNTGYLVWTEIKAGGKTKKMWLPVMDGSNKAMKDKPYEYTTKFGKKYVEAVTMFDINKTIMRCLVKNIAMFGIGLYIYSGEDLPEEPVEVVKTKTISADQLKELNNLIAGAKLTEEVFCKSMKIKEPKDLVASKFEEIKARLVAKAMEVATKKEEVADANNN